MQIYKSPLEQSNALIKQKAQPFNVDRISHKQHQRPYTMFDNYRLTEISPNDYFKFVSHQNFISPEELMQSREEVANEMSIADMRKNMREGVKFDTPWLYLSDKGHLGTVHPEWQEGLHRMLAAGQEYGMDTKFPMYLGYEKDSWDDFEKMPMDDFIKHYDSVREERQKKYEEEQAAKRRERDESNRKWTAHHFKVPIEQVTPEMVKEYLDWDERKWKEEW